MGNTKALSGAKDLGPLKAFVQILILLVFDSDMRNFVQDQGKIGF